MVGHDEVKQALAQQAWHGAPPSILIAGDTGTGKSALANIYARSVLCRSPATGGDACGVCQACDAVQSERSDGGFFVLHAEDQVQTRVRDVIARITNWSAGSGDRGVVLLDDADSLIGWEFLKGQLDRPQPSTPVFIATCSEPNRVPKQIRDRMDVFHLRQSTVEERVRVLERVCALEKLPANLATLQSIAEETANHRQALGLFEKVAARGPVESAADVFGVLSGEGVWVQDYFLSIAAKDLAGQLTAIAQAPEPPGEAVATLLRAVNASRLTHEHDSHLMAGVRSRYANASFHEAAKTYGLTVPEFWDVVTGYWIAAPTPQGLDAFRSLAIGFGDRLETLTLSGPSKLAKLEAGGHPRSRRRGPMQSASDSPQFLSYDQVSQLYDAATFALQVHGACFNTVIEITWAEAPSIRLGTAIDRFAQGLQRTVERAGGGEGHRFCRVLLHRRGTADERITTIVGCVPPQHRDVLEKWLDKYRTPGSVRLVRAPVDVPARNRIGLHWALMRELWGGLDPQVCIGGVSMLDLLGVPAEHRRPVGAPFARRFSTSQNIGENAQQHLARLGIGHLSALNDGAFSWLDGGWELPLYKRWLRHGIIRDAEISRFKLRSPGPSQTRWNESVKNNVKKQIDIHVLSQAPWLNASQSHSTIDEFFAEISPLFAELG